MILLGNSSFSVVLDFNNSYYNESLRDQYKISKGSIPTFVNSSCQAPRSIPYLEPPTYHSGLWFVSSQGYA